MSFTILATVQLTISKVHPGFVARTKKNGEGQVDLIFSSVRVAIVPFVRLILLQLRSRVLGSPLPFDCVPNANATKGKTHTHTQTGYPLYRCSVCIRSLSLSKSASAKSRCAPKTLTCCRSTLKFNLHILWLGLVGTGWDWLGRRLSPGCICAQSAFKYFVLGRHYRHPQLENRGGSHIILLYTRVDKSNRFCVKRTRGGQTAFGMRFAKNHNRKLPYHTQAKGMRDSRTRDRPQHIFRAIHLLAPAADAMLMARYIYTCIYGHKHHFSCPTDHSI